MIWFLELIVAAPRRRCFTSDMKVRVAVDGMAAARSTSGATTCDYRALSHLSPAPCDGLGNNRRMGTRRTDGERIEVTGVVQGVGFRPFVHRLAIEAGLDGFVGNDSTRVFIEVTGPQARIDEFARRLVAEAPPLAQVESVTRTACAAADERGFRIVESRCVAGARTLIAPDTAVCDDCVAEMNDPADRRFRHPFITCTNCGPRFTIIRDLPYDRPTTTMAAFDMCDACAAEYRRSRRPPLPRPADLLSRLRAGAALPQRTRRRGRRPATPTRSPRRWRRSAPAGRSPIKGLGGYHLACDATDDARGRAPAPAQGPSRQAVRRHGRGPRRRPPPRRGERRRGHPVARTGPADRVAPRPGRRIGLGTRRSRQSDARGHAPVHSAPPPAVPPRRSRARDDERQPRRRAARVPRRRRGRSGWPVCATLS